MGAMLGIVGLCGPDCVRQRGGIGSLEALAIDGREFCAGNVHVESPSVRVTMRKFGVLLFPEVSAEEVLNRTGVGVVGDASLGRREDEGMHSGAARDVL